MPPTIRGITVSVNYDDLLAVTLPRNAKFLERVVVVTTPEDHKTLAVTARVPNAVVYCTDAFTRDGATFNKGLAIEEGLTFLGREGWILSFDSDIVLPPEFPFQEQLDERTLYGPWRRILEDASKWEDYCNPAKWPELPRFEETWELAGACLLFNTAAPHLGDPPWFGTTWKGAQGYDTEFFRRWPKRFRHRWDRDVLHLGKHSENWYGRQTERLDGTMPEGHQQAARKIALMRLRRKFTRAKYPYPEEHITPCESS